MDANTRLLQTSPSYPLVEGRENVWETNLHSWSRPLHWPCCCRNLMLSWKEVQNLWSWSQEQQSIPRMAFGAGWWRGLIFIRTQEVTLSKIIEWCMIFLSMSCVRVLNIEIGNENGKISKSFCFSSITLFSPSLDWIPNNTLHTSQPTPVFLHLHVHSKFLKAPAYHIN